MEALDKISQREQGIKDWLDENAPYIAGDQKHLDDGTVERAYWHYGYLVALRDVRSLLTKN